MPTVFEHLVFDLDGTLVDSRVDLSAAVNHVLRTFRLPELSVETVCRHVGEGARVLVQRALGPAHERRLDEGLEVFLTYYAVHLLDQTVAYDGIPETLAALTDAAVVLSVLTNKPAAMSCAILDGLGLLPHFAAVVGGDSLPLRKPNPAGIDHLLARTRTSRERTVLVGDSLIDLHTARAAQIAFCGAAWGLRRADLIAAGIDRMVDHPRQLVHIAGVGRR